MAIPSEQADGFANNWAYLKTELQWLERVLLLAVARQRKDTKEIDRLSQTTADRATSHWWKGVIALDGNIAYDEHRQPQTGAKLTYQQQMEGQIVTSQRRGIVLALPTLRDRLHLKEFEKNLVLMALAPEVNRRFAQLYRFLQGNEGGQKSDLPTLDLILRLLCRTDSEWYIARNYLLTASPLFKTNLVQRLSSVEQTILSSPVKLADRLVNYLLADQPTLSDLDALLHSAGQKSPAAPVAVLNRTVYLRKSAPAPAAASEGDAWSTLILPSEALASLQYLTQQIAGQLQATTVWNLGAQLKPKGRFVLLAGKPGTGKTTAAETIAHALNVPLFTVDLAQIDPADYPTVLQEISLHSPVIVLIKSAQQWLDRSSTLPVALLHQFFKTRSQLPAVTCFSVTHQASVQIQWQRQTDTCLTLPMPGAIDRLKLWKRAFPPQVSVTEQMPWEALANQLPVSGGTIGEIVHDTICYAAAVGAATVEVTHLHRVCQQRGYDLKLPTTPQEELRSIALLQPTSKRKSVRKKSVAETDRTVTQAKSLAESPEILPETPSDALLQTPEPLAETSPVIAPGKARKPPAAARRKRTKES